MKHLDSIIAGYRNILNEAEAFLSPLDRKVYKSYIHMLTNDVTKRLIFDARQAQVFDDIGEFTLETDTAKIKPPFEHFFLEFTEPILLKAQEEGYTDWLRGFIFWSNLDVVTIRESKDVRRVEYIHKLTMFFKDEHGDWVDRTFSLSQKFEPLVTRHSTGIDKDMAEGLGIVRGVPLPDWVGDDFVVSGFQDPDNPRSPTWWENCIQSYTSLFLWMNSYMMAKSVKIQEIPLSRQIRRAAEREGKIPNPWHMVKVEPKHTKGKAEMVGGEGKEHGYRYSVIGHIRKGRHKRKDGTYAEGIEWVEAHERGLKHELYIPKTYKVEGNRKIDTTTLKQYLNQK
jgi:hypothetical protein